jgi:hypothetical protein
MRPMSPTSGGGWPTMYTISSTELKQGDIPIYQAAKFWLVINLKTANALGPIFPRSLLLFADEVIE